MLREALSELSQAGGVDIIKKVRVPQSDLSIFRLTVSLAAYLGIGRDEL